MKFINNVPRETLTINQKYFKNKYCIKETNMIIYMRATSYSEPGQNRKIAALSELTCVHILFILKYEKVFA